MIEADVVGGRELARTLGNLPVELEKKIMRSALRAGANVFLREVRARIPVDEGDLARSARVTTRYQKGQVSASVKVGNSIAWYARMVEFGTRPHYISVSDQDRGRGRGIGRRGSAARRETLASMSTVNRRALIIGANFVGPSVRHPGARARQFMRPAADLAFPKAVAAITAKIRERLRKEGFSAPEPQDSE